MENEIKNDDFEYRFSKEEIMIIELHEKCKFELIDPMIKQKYLDKITQKTEQRIEKAKSLVTKLKDEMPLYYLYLCPVDNMLLSNEDLCLVIVLDTDDNTIGEYKARLAEIVAEQKSNYYKIEFKCLTLNRYYTNMIYYNNYYKVNEEKSTIYNIYKENEVETEVHSSILKWIIGIIVLVVTISMMADTQYKIEEVGATLLDSVSENYFRFSRKA